MSGLRRPIRADERGQTLLEFAMCLPLVLVLTLGVVEVSYGLLDQHVVTKLSREGSNLISRDSTLLDTGTALKSMSSRPVNFDATARMIFSVIKMVDTAGAANNGFPVLYQRYEYGAIAAASRLNTAGNGAFGGAPDFLAANSDTDPNLRVLNLPPNLMIPGGLIYVTEVYSRHPLITPFDRLGIQVPSTLYSIAYF